MTYKSAGRVFDKIDRAVDGELITDIIGACAAVIITAIVASAPDIATALQAFDKFVALTRVKLVEDWDAEYKGPIKN
jgi:hypothetical protein